MYMYHGCAGEKAPKSVPVKTTSCPWIWNAPRCKSRLNEGPSSPYLVELSTPSGANRCKSPKTAGESVNATATAIAATVAKRDIPTDAWLARKVPDREEATCACIHVDEMTVHSSHALDLYWCPAVRTAARFCIHNISARIMEIPHIPWHAHSHDREPAPPPGMPIGASLMTRNGARSE